jgi:intracellular septation protein
MGFVNLWVAFHFDTDTWVNFKLFGGLGLMAVFIVAQALYLSRFVNEPE